MIDTWISLIIDEPPSYEGDEDFVTKTEKLTSNPSNLAEIQINSIVITGKYCLLCLDDDT